MSEVTPTPDATAPEQAAPVETPPAAAPVEAQAAPAAVVDQEVVQPDEATPAAPEAQPAAEAPASAAPAPDVDPLTVLSADLARVSAEKDTIQSNHDRMYAEVNTLQRDLDAARAELAQERATRSPLPYQQQITDMRLQIAQMEAENTQLKQQAAAPAPVAELKQSEPPLVHLTEEALGKIKNVFLGALAEHAVAQVAPEAAAQPEPPAAPSSPFINRQG